MTDNTTSGSEHSDKEELIENVREHVEDRKSAYVKMGTADSPDSRSRTPTRINSRDCGWCGAVAMQGPFAHPDYESEWYLCDYCAETVDGMEPDHDAVELYPDHYSVTITVDGTVVTRYTEEN